MNRKGFMIRLESHLAVLTDTEKAEILFDMNEHFDIAESQGKTEEEIIEALGSPEDIAAQYLPESAERVQNSEQVVNSQHTFITQDIQNPQVSNKKAGKIVIAIIVGFFSITTIIPILFSFAMAILSLIVSGGAIVISGILGAFSGYIESIIPEIINGLPFGNLANLLFGISTICFGFLWTVGWIYVWRQYWKLIKLYFNFLINIMRLK